MKYFWILILVTVISIILAISCKDNFTIKQTTSRAWNGLCLFDIDGTLTTGIDNEKSVELCLQAGYAVGITTSGAMYTPDNLMNFTWMPKNLYDFMEKHEFNTFNNVASNIITGKYDPSIYQDIRKRFWGRHEMWGILKGKSLVVTANLYDINHKNIVLFDNDPGFLDGLSMYNPDIKGVCAGNPCGPVMTPQTVYNALH